MAGVIRTGLVVFGILWALSTLFPDAPRVTVGSRPVTIKMRSVRQVLFVVGALGAGIWYAARRDRKAQQPGVTVTPATGSPAVFRAEATPVGEPPVVTVAEPPPRQSVEHRLDVHEAQIQELTEDVADLLAVRPVAAPKPRRKKGTA